MEQDLVSRIQEKMAQEGRDWLRTILQEADAAAVRMEAGRLEEVAGDTTGGRPKRRTRPPVRLSEEGDNVRGDERRCAAAEATAVGSRRAAPQSGGNGRRSEQEAGSSRRAVPLVRSGDRRSQAQRGLAAYVTGPQGIPGCRSGSQPGAGTRGRQILRRAVRSIPGAPAPARVPRLFEGAGERSPSGSTRGQSDRGLGREQPASGLRVMPDGASRSAGWIEGGGAQVFGPGPVVRSVEVGTGGSVMPGSPGSSVGTQETLDSDGAVGGGSVSRLPLHVVHAASRGVMGADGESFAEQGSPVVPAWLAAYIDSAVANTVEKIQSGGSGSQLVTSAGGSVVPLVDEDEGRRLVSRLPSHASGSGSQPRHGRYSGRSRSRRHGDRRRDGSRDRSRSGGLEKSRSYRAVSHSSSGSSRHSGAQIRETFVDDREVRSQVSPCLDGSSQVVATVAAVEQSQPSVPTVVLQRSDPAMGVRTQPSDGVFSGTASEGPGGRGTLPPACMGNSRGQLIALVKQSVTPATWRRHGSAWQHWLRIAGGRFPSRNEEHLQVTFDYMADLRDAGASASMVSKNLAGVAFMLKLWCFKDVTKHFVIRQVVKGWRKETPSLEARRPVTFAILSDLLNLMQEICRDAYETCLFKAAFVIVFFCALRISELVPCSKGKPGGLLVSDVMVVDNVVKVCVRKSKTDSRGRGSWLSIHSTGGGLCPVAIVHQFVLLRAQGKSFLLHADGAPLTRFQVVSVFKTGLAHLGLVAGDFGSHSFRIGAATEAERLGLGEQGIKQLGRWKSDSYKSYIRPDLVSC
ncbi:hypothetical protein PRIEUP_LOCUS14722 [Pristimantis euphronides]